MEDKIDFEKQKIRALEVMIMKEELLAKIIVYLKTKGLYEECIGIVAPEMLKTKKTDDK